MELIVLIIVAYVLMHMLTSPGTPATAEQRMHMTDEELLSEQINRL